MGKADLHVHTALGDGMAEIPELLAYAEEETDLSIIAVTEHDDLRAAFAAREAWARGSYRYELIVGEEVTTLEGHLVALFIEEPVRSLQPLAPTLEAVHRQRGLCIIPHPMSWLTRSVGQRTIERVLREGRDGVFFDGIETASGNQASGMTAKKVRKLNRERYRLAEVGGSDAHFLKTLGAAYTEFHGTTAEDLRAAILGGATSAREGRRPSLREIGFGQIVRQQWRGMLATPRKMGWLPTIRSFLRLGRP